jgi:hypothetical protein
MSTGIAELGAKLFEQQRRTKEIAMAMKAQAETFSAERGRPGMSCKIDRMH